MDAENSAVPSQKYI